MSNAIRTPRDFTLFTADTFDSAHDADAAVGLALHLHDADCGAAAAAVAEHGAYTPSARGPAAARDRRAWLAQRAAKVREIEERLEREAEREEAAARKLAPVTPITVAADDAPSADDLNDEAERAARGEDPDDALLDLLVAQVQRRHPNARGKRGASARKAPLRGEGLRLLALAGYGPAVARA